MKSTLSFLLRLLAVLALVGAVAFVVVKYIDVIIGFFNDLKNKLLKGKCACGDENCYDDIELEDICLDPDCPCKADEE